MKRAARPATIFIFGLVVIFIAGVGIVTAWFRDDLDMSRHGWIAYGLACLFTTALAGGLFGLLFKSSRDGHDDTNHYKQ